MISHALLSPEKVTMTFLRCTFAFSWLIVVGTTRNVGDATEGSGPIISRAVPIEISKLPVHTIEVSADISQPIVDVPRTKFESPQQSEEASRNTLEIPRTSVEIPRASMKVHQASAGVPEVIHRPTSEERESLLENEFSVTEEVTTSVALDLAAGSRGNFKLPVFDEKIRENDTSGFKPSVHLGEIESPRSKSGPFNNLQHIRFENTLDVRDLRGSVEQDGIQDEYFEQRGSRVKFQDDGYAHQAARILHQDQSSAHRDHGMRPLQVTHSSRSHFEDPADPSKIILEQQDVGQNQQFLQNFDGVSLQHSSHDGRQAFLGKPSKFYDDDKRDQGYALGLSNFDALRLPYLIYGHYNDHNGDDKQVGVREPMYGTFHKPSGSVLYFAQQQEPHVTQTRKLPYQIYQYPGSYHEFQFLEEPHAIAYMPRRRRISPWKKIIQLISAFLPLGLLLATLTPNVVRIGNTTEPNIVLSKWRVNDQAVEHKEARVADDSGDVCEERSICELILGGGKPQSNLLQNILWNLATRISQDTAKLSDLQDVFDAVKNKNCGSVDC